MTFYKSEGGGTPSGISFLLLPSVVSSVKSRGTGFDFCSRDGI